MNEMKIFSLRNGLTHVHCEISWENESFLWQMAIDRKIIRIEMCAYLYILLIKYDYGQWLFAIMCPTVVFDDYATRRMKLKREGMEEAMK